MRGSIVKPGIIVKGNDIVHSSVVVHGSAVNRNMRVSGTVVTRSIAVKGGIMLKYNRRTPGILGPTICTFKVTAINRHDIVPSGMEVKGGATVSNVAIPRSCPSNRLTNKRMVATGSNSRW